MHRPRFWSTQDDVTLGNPFGPFVHGFDEVVHTMQLAASFYRDGEAVGFDLVAKHVTEGLALLVEVERLKAKMGGARTRPRSRSALRASSETRAVHGSSCIATRIRSRPLGRQTR